MMHDQTGYGMAGSQYLRGNNMMYNDQEEDNWDQESEESEATDFSVCEERQEFKFENGALYKGKWMQNVRHGYGVQKWPDGAKYEGQWKKNKAHGKGIFWHVYGDKYEG